MSALGEASRVIQFHFRTIFHNRNRNIYKLNSTTSWVVLMRASLLPSFFFPIFICAPRNSSGFVLLRNEKNCSCVKSSMRLMVSYSFFFSLSLRLPFRTLAHTKDDGDENSFNFSNRQECQREWSLMLSSGCARRCRSVQSVLRE